MDINTIRNAFKFVLDRYPSDEDAYNCSKAFADESALLAALKNSAEFLASNDINLVRNCQDLELNSRFRIYLDSLNANSQNNKDILRIVTREKWRTIDTFDQLLTGNIKITCRLCLGEFVTSNKKIQRLESECIFEGGHLIRYVCPHCGGIIGPLKMLRLTPNELADEYSLCYSVFDEAETTEVERRVFYDLKPEKGKRYLDYGCGKWSSTVQTLRAEGYDVYGFDAFIGENNEYMIREKETLKLMKFDGIFSKNLIEHMAYPIDEFKFLKSLLRDSESKMAHATPCYTYSYEYTRFHLHFYTGNSVNKLCEICGLKVVDTIIYDVDDQINKIYMSI